MLRSVTTNRAKSEKTFHWAQTQPHSTYLCALIAGPYLQVKDLKGALPDSYWVYPKDAPAAERSFGQTREIIDFFPREFGYPHPWPKFDQIILPDFRGGAERTNATVIDDKTIHDARAEQDFPTHWLVAHEAAHQWWGDLVFQIAIREASGHTLDWFFDQWSFRAGQPVLEVSEAWDAGTVKLRVIQK